MPKPNFNQGPKAPRRLKNKEIIDYDNQLDSPHISKFRQNQIESSPLSKINQCINEEHMKSSEILIFNQLRHKNNRLNELF